MAKRALSSDADSTLATDAPVVVDVVVTESGPTGADATTPPAGANASDGAGTDAPPKPPEQPAEPELLTPLEWAARKGYLVDGREPYTKGFHASAEQLYGWTWHAHNFQAPAQAFKLTEADYDAALAAAGEYPAVPAHEAAFAPQYPKPVVPEHIAKACAAARAPKAEEKKG